jgi:diguanylate cyclase (GGDEF)-like protein
MGLGRTLPIVALLLAATIVTVGISFKRYDDAYTWVAHTSDVRVVIGRAIGRVATLDALSCQQLATEIDHFEELTRDNRVQQAFVPSLRDALARDCREVTSTVPTQPATLLRYLTAADAHERDLLSQRRAHLASTRRWTLIALVLTIVGSLVVLAFAHIVQQRALRRVETMAKQLEQIAVTDELTKLYNRRGFLFVGSQAYALAKRQKKRTAVLFADLDGLKAINDKHGHERGDDAIREFGALLKATLRTTDVTARLGGDEFVALLYDVDDAHVASAERRVRDALDAWNSRGTSAYLLAASIGFARPSLDDERPLESVLQEADVMMYEKKRAARLAAGRGSRERI